MKFTPFIAWAILAYGTVADDAQKVLSEESSASSESATPSVLASLPTFTVSSFLHRPSIDTSPYPPPPKLAVHPSVS